MLRNVLEDYLSSIKERDFDFPLSSLLQGMGFYDIHFTHGGVEFGKDFIAKKLDEGVEFQYAIQSKKGDINQALWRNEVRGQLEEAILSDLSHPQFNTTAPRKAILVTTGRLSGNARLACQEFKAKFEAENRIHEILFWEKEQLAQYSEEFGFAGVHQSMVTGLKEFAQFYLTYSKAVEGSLSDREIEELSRLWLDESLDFRKRILRASVESEIIAAKLIEQGHVYEAITAYMSLLRLVMQVTYENDDPFVLDILSEIIETKLLPLSGLFFNEFKSNWEGAERSLLNLCLKESPLPMLNYIVWCARVLEITSLYFFLTKDAAERARAVSYLSEFIKSEEGCGHIAGDRHAVSIVWPSLAMIAGGKTDDAVGLIKRSVIWLCDRVDKGFGLARYEADEYEETATLLGYPFDFIKVEHNRCSFLATILTDLAAFIGDKDLYADIVNDFEACEIVYNYWQFPDTKAIFTIDTEECRSYPNIPHQPSMERFDDFEYAEHIKHEPDSFKISQKAGLHGFLFLSILLKDRYFPKMWRLICEGTSNVQDLVEARTAH
jgi:hypothetical protein